MQALRPCHAARADEGEHSKEPPAISANTLDGSIDVASRLQPSHARYEAALRRAVGLADFERSTHSPGNADFHIERMSLMLDRLGDPHLGTPTVHVAGTDGKGSTAAMVTSMLTAAGYKAGLYHLAPPA